jgi:hypothetical protein
MSLRRIAICAVISSALGIWPSPSVAGDQACNSSLGVKICLVEASVRTRRAFDNGSQEIDVSVALEVTNQSKADLSLSLAKEPIAVMIGGVAVNRFANKTGLVGLKRGDRPGDFVVFGVEQAQRVAMNFQDTFNVNEIEAMGRANTAQLSAIFNVAEASGVRQASVSLSGFSIRNQIRTR